MYSSCYFLAEKSNWNSCAQFHSQNEHSCYYITVCLCKVERGIWIWNNLLSQVQGKFYLIRERIQIDLRHQLFTSSFMCREYSTVSTPAKEYILQLLCFRIFANEISWPKFACFTLWLIFTPSATRKAYSKYCSQLMTYVALI